MARGRRPQIRWWKQNGGGYFYKHEGVRVALAMGPDDAPTGPTYTKARDAYKSLIEKNAGRGTDGVKVSALADARTRFLESRGKSASLNNHKFYVMPFVEQMADRRVDEVRAFHVREWLETRTTWGDSSRRLAVKLVIGLFGWGVRDGQCDTNPLKGRLDLPADRPRGAECRLDTILSSLLISNAVTPAQRDVLLMLRGTGARPNEVESIEAWNVEDGLIRFKAGAVKGHVHKQSRRGKKCDRVIHLSDDLAALVAGLAAKYPTGTIFRDAEDRPWTKATRNGQWVELLKRKNVRDWMDTMGIARKHVVPYSFRHTFISDWIDAGLSVAIVAELCGTSITQIEKVYGHPDEGKMRAFYLNFTKSRTL